MTALSARGLRALFSTLPLLVACGAACAQDGRQPPLPAIALMAGDHAISAEVARSGHEREIGLMFRASLAPDEGMLFVFGDPQRQCFWMHNTLIPLAAAFVADDGRIINIVEMAPNTDDSHCSTREVRFVLEMNGGWFAKHGIAAGAYITGEPFTR